MKKLIVILLLLLPALSLADGWPWVPTGRNGIKPVGDKVIEVEYALTAAGSVPTTDMRGTITNRGATGTIEINLLAASGSRDFNVREVEGQTIELDFPSGANPYLQGVQIGADHEIDIPAGGELRIIYDADDDLWKCFMVWLVSTDGGADNGL